MGVYGERGVEFNCHDTRSLRPKLSTLPHFVMARFIRAIHARVHAGGCEIKMGYSEVEESHSL